MAGNGLDSGDAIRGSDKFRFFRGWNTDQSAGERDVPFNDLVTYLNSAGSGLTNGVIGEEGSGTATASAANTVRYFIDTDLSNRLAQIDSSGNVTYLEGLAFFNSTGDETAVNGHGYVIDASGGTVTLTLPAAPNAGEKVFYYVENADNAVTIARNGSNINGSGADLTPAVNTYGTLIYTGASTGWRNVTPASAGGSVDSARLDTLENNLAINTLNDVIVEGRTVFNMVDQFSDAFWDATGIDAGTSTDETYDTAGDYYHNPSSSADLIIQSDSTDGNTTFTNSGDVTSTPTVYGDTQHDDSLGATGDPFGGSLTGIQMDGTGDALYFDATNLTAPGTGEFYMSGWVRFGNTTGLRAVFGSHDGTNTGFYLRTDTGTGLVMIFGNTARITVATTYSFDTWHHIAVSRSGTDLNLYLDGSRIGQDLSNTDNMQFQSTAFMIGATDATATTQNNLAHYQDIQYESGTAGIYTGASYTVPTSLGATTAANMVLVSNSVTASAAPSTGRMVVLFDPVDAVTLNTDLVCEFSRDGGSTWATATLSYDQDYDANIRILTTDDIDLSGTTSGTSIVVRATVANNKQLRIHGWTAQWR